jgi:hypothetical protein
VSIKRVLENWSTCLGSQAKLIVSCVGCHFREGEKVSFFMKNKKNFFHSFFLSLWYFDFVWRPLAFFLFRLSSKATTGWTRNPLQVIRANYSTTSLEQGCQIFLRATYQNWEKFTKKHTFTNGHKYIHMTNGCKIDQMAIKYTNIFHWKSLRNLPNWDFWF